MAVWSVSIPGSIDDVKKMLNRQIADVQARIGIFLQQKQRLLILGERASALGKLPQTASSSFVLVSRVKAGEDQQEQIEKDSMRFINEANNLYTQLQTDPLWSKLAQADMGVLGWASINKIKMMTQSSVNVASNLANTLKRINGHIGMVDSIEKDIESEESFASGRGFRASATGILGGVKSTLTAPLMMIGAAVGLYLLFMSGAMFKRRA